MFIRYSFLKAETGEPEQITGICKVKSLVLDNNVIRVYDDGRLELLRVVLPFRDREAAVQAFETISCALELGRNLCDISNYQWPRIPDKG